MFVYNGEGDLYEIRNYRTMRASFFEYDHAGRCMGSRERSFTVSNCVAGTVLLTHTERGWTVSLCSVKHILRE